LKPISTTRGYHVHDEIDHVVNFNFRLTYTHCLDQNGIIANMLTEELNFASVESNSSKDTSGGRRPDKGVSL